MLLTEMAPPLAFDLLEASCPWEEFPGLIVISGYKHTRVGLPCPARRDQQFSTCSSVAWEIKGKPSRKIGVGFSSNREPSFFCYHHVKSRP